MVSARGSAPREGTGRAVRRNFICRGFRVKTFLQLPELQRQGAIAGRRYLEFLRVPAMSAGLYVLPAGAKDTQTPHLQDEIYYVVSGRARMRVGAEGNLVGDEEVMPGTAAFVSAGTEHFFYDIVEELVVLVCFAPAES